MPTRKRNTEKKARLRVRLPKRAITVGRKSPEPLETPILEPAPGYPPELLKAREQLRRRWQDRMEKARKAGLGEQHGFENISAITVGEKTKDGVKTGEPCVVVHVIKKVMDPARLHRAATVPKQIGKFATDVVESGHIRAFYGEGPYRPAPGGCSMSSRLVAGGTLACAVTSVPGGETCFLGANHTFAAGGTAQEGDWLLQPSPVGGGVYPTHAIARLWRAVPLDFDGWNEVDCALAVTRPELADTTLLQIGALVGPPIDPVSGTAVMKVGATTGLRRGVIQDPDVPAPIQYELPSVRWAWFRHLFQIAAIDGVPFAEPGDSGALIVEVNTHRPVGMIVGGDQNFVYGCRLTSVLTALQAALPVNRASFPVTSPS